MWIRTDHDLSVCDSLEVPLEHGVEMASVLGTARVENTRLVRHTTHRCVRRERVRGRCRAGRNVIGAVWHPVWEDEAILSERRHYECGRRQDAGRDVTIGSREHKVP